MKKELFLFVVLLYSLQGFSQDKIFTRVCKLMGSRYEISVVAQSGEKGDEYIEMAISEIERIERIISSWRPDSETSRINMAAGVHPVKVSEELFGLIQRCLKLSEITSGAFDISYAAMDRIWKFDGSMRQMPTPEEVAASVKNVGYQNIVLDEGNRTVFLKKEGMKIGFGAVGKGYSADQAKSLLKSYGVKGGLINASGDLTVWGEQPDEKPWIVGITNPLNKNKVFSWFPILDGAVVTSGDYEKFVVLDGRRYSHIIDPRTGYPSHGLVSVTVFAPKAELADALSTAVFVMGADVGLNLVDQLNGVDCVLVTQGSEILKSGDVQISREKPGD
ncbi:FAD:protein FMN transferase [Marinilabilia sp.]|uniref:FAD:protein FMN transferase n=1 Tax=Marinilabilia sp. TaxID=2021252 RepID=UPI0025BD7316|nr:FAD:protein FMN transferase [Marinilabilia sp.]